MFKMLLTTVTIISIATPCLSREVHATWKMKCWPDDGPPFVVISDVNKSTLNIISFNDFIRENEIIFTEDEKVGFHVVAKGFGKDGKRVIDAHFSYDGGFLEIIPYNGPSIQCGPNIPLSDD